MSSLRAAKTERRFFCFLVFLFLSLNGFGCDEEAGHVTVRFTHSGAGASPVIEAEVAASQSKRQLGLMYRKKLGEGEGMLFVFPDEAPRTFWMKNTYLELDMIFINSRFEVVSVIEKAVPLSETTRESKQPAKYVLEVKGGSAAKWGIAAGSKISVDGELPAAT